MNLSNMPETAPKGYKSNYEALLGLLRFGNCFMKPGEMRVMLFHAERSTVRGRISAQSSRRDALQGVYVMELGRWIRGPAGVTKKTWHKANAELVRKGFLRTYARQDRFGGYEPTEYEIVWTAFAEAVRKWKASQCESLSLFNLEPLDEEKGA